MRSFSVWRWVITIHSKDELPKVFPAIAGTHIPAGSLVTSWEPKHFGDSGESWSTDSGVIRSSDEYRKKGQDAEIDAAHMVHKTMEMIGGMTPVERLVAGFLPSDWASTDGNKPAKVDRIEENRAHPNLKHARVLAAQCDWRELWHKPEEKRVRFKKGINTYVDVWYTRMTVGTIITHPTKGRGQLFRKHVSKGLLEDIFKNPRVHTGEGYYKA